PDRAIQLVNVANGLRTRMILGNARAVGETVCPLVPGPRVDFVELDHGETRQRPDEPATTKRRMTITIATPWNRTRRCIQRCDCSPVTSRPDAMFMTPRTRTYAVAAIARTSRIRRGQRIASP